MTVIAAPRVVAGRRLLSPGWVRLAGGRVAEVGAGPPPGPGVRLPDGLLAPGLVDLQVNGAYGVDLAAADAAQWFEVVRRLPETGVTAFVPTVVSAPMDRLVGALRRYHRLRERLDAAPRAARTLGLHLEGPFLSGRRRGIHPAEHLCDPTPPRVRALLDAGGGDLAYVTLAPERAHAIDAIRQLRAAGVLVAVGHSDAPDDVVRAAADAGATLVTHLFNAQRPLHHRDPGVVGAALTDRRLTCGLIADLHHVAATAVRVAFAAAGGRVALVTDAVAAMGTPARGHEVGVLTVDAGGPPRLADGTLAGSALRMDAAVANTVRCGVGLVDAVEAATRVPADALGRPDLGRLEPGARADLVWLADDLRARATWVGGALAFVGPDGAAAGQPPT